MPPQEISSDKEHHPQVMLLIELRCLTLPSQ